MTTTDGAVKLAERMQSIAIHPESVLTPEIKSVFADGARALLALKAENERLVGNQRTAGTVEKCELCGSSLWDACEFTSEVCPIRRTTEGGGNDPRSNTNEG